MSVKEILRTLLYVPRMHTEDELEIILGFVPEDFHSRSEEFWKYVQKRLEVFSGRVKKIYRDSIWRGGVDDLRLIEILDPECYRIILDIVQKGGELQATEDRLLIEETESWMNMIRSRSDPSLIHLLQQNLEDRNRYLANRIENTLLDGEIGVLFIEPNRRISLPDTVRVIKVCPFDPKDYLQGWIVRIKHIEGSKKES